MPQASIRKRITTPRELAAGMARLAQGFRDSVAQDLAGDGPSDFVIDLRNAYASARMPELAEVAKAEQFADVFAQTLVYGLFALRCAHPAGQFRRRAAKVALPVSDPFLCRLLETLTPPEFDREPYAGFFHSLLQLLENTNLHGVLESLSGRGLGPDPIEHFYETFLAAYNPQLRKACGVYYTPGPVVSFIVRAVDDLLKKGFGIRSGLAEHKMPPRVFILDPACGTGNFLCGVIGHVRDVYVSRKASLRTWSGYARSCLLPRLHGFEMLPVPYAIAHLQLDRLTGHDRPVGRLRDRGFPSNGQPNVRLKNTFDEVVERAEQLLECLNNTQAPMPTGSLRSWWSSATLPIGAFRQMAADGSGDCWRTTAESTAPL